MKKLFVLLVLCGVASAASAGDFDYTFLEAAYSHADTGADHGLLNWAPGYRLDGSYALGGGFLIEGSYQRNRSDNQGVVVVGGGVIHYDSQLTADSLRGGLGYHLAIASNLDILLSADYGHAGTKTNFGTPPSDESDDGYALGATLRIQATQALEFDAGLSHDDLGLGLQPGPCPFSAPCGLTSFHQSSSETVLSGAARYRFGAVGVGLEYRHSSFESWREWLASVRWNF